MIEIIQTILLVIIIVTLIWKFKPKATLKKTKEKKALLDSCALIDGRIIELTKTGFVPSQLVVPAFIVSELQLLADGNDSHKRERARFGLEVVQLLQQEKNVTVTIDRTHVKAKKTDDKLVELAKKIGGELYTTDYNLNQVASIEGVKVLNVNELSHALRPIALPGEGHEIKILQSGSNRDQGVGYLDDGTMVVVDNARRDIGKKIKVDITRTHQTIAGKMLFAKKVDESTKYSKETHTPKKIAYKKSPTTKRETSLFKAVDDSYKR